MAGINRNSSTLYLSIIKHVGCGRTASRPFLLTDEEFGTSSNFLIDYQLAALTFWYEFYYDIYPHKFQYMWKIKQLHEEYGPIVRISK
jgi:hypothetical protein